MPESDEGDSNGTESSDTTDLQFQQQMRSQRRMEVRISSLQEKSEADPEKHSQEDPEKIREIEHIMGNLLSVLKDQNATADALRARFKVSQDMELDHVIPFSSDRKYSGAAFTDTGTYLMGAVQFLFPEGNPELMEYCGRFAEEGLRVLVLAHSVNVSEGSGASGGTGTCRTFAYYRCDPCRGTGYTGIFRKSGC